MSLEALMTENANDEQFLDRIVDSILKQPILNKAPDEVNRRILALGDDAGQQVLPSVFSYRSFFADWIGMVALTATLLVAMDLAWCIYISRTTAVSWVRDAETNTWRVMHDNMLLEIRQPPAEFHSRL
jgi:hypothetical protein